MKVLTQAGFVRSKRTKPRTCYKRDEKFVRDIKKTVLAGI